MKILLIHQAFVSPQEAGGTRHYEFAQHCVRSGHQFSIVASDLSYLTGKRGTPERKVVTIQESHGITILRAYTYASLHKSFLWRIISFLSFMCTSVVAGLRAGPVDVVMGTSPPIFQAFSAWVISAIRRKPFLLEIRDLWPEFAVDMGVLKSKFLIRLAKWLEKFLYTRADHILVNSPAYRDYIIGKGLPAAKVSVISNGVDPNMFDPEATGEAIREELGLNGHFVVTYAGALGMANDIPTILHAAAELRGITQVKFLFVGDGKERTRLRQLADSLDLSNVLFVGARPKSQMKDFLAASNACVATLQNIPMFRTTYPNKVFDYMAAGRPTLLAIDGVIRTVVERAEGGLFIPPGDPKALAKAILELHSNPGIGKEMGKSARSYVEEHFNRGSQAREFVSLVQQLTSK